MKEFDRGVGDASGALSSSLLYIVGACLFSRRCCCLRQASFPKMLLWCYCQYFLLLLAALLPAFAAAGARKLYEWDPEAKNIIEFRGLTRGKVFENAGVRVLELYNPFCGHCVSFKPRYIESADEVRKAHPEVEFHAISCLHHDDVCRERFEFGGFPSLFLIPPGVRDNFQKKAIPLKNELSWEEIDRTLRSLEGRKLDANGAGREDSGDEWRNSEDLNSDEDIKDEPRDIESASGDLNDGNLEVLESPENDSEEDADLTGEELGSEDVRNDSEEERFNQPHEEGEEINYDKEPGESGDDEKHDKPIVVNQKLGPRVELSDGPRPGAKLARQQPNLLDQFNAEYKKKLESRRRFRPWTKADFRLPHKDPDEATDFMKANQAHTKEYQRRKQKYIEYLEKMKRAKKGSKVNPDVVKLSQKIGKLPFQKKVTRPKLVEKLPVVKRLAKMSPEEELMLDVTGAFLHGMSFDVFRTSVPLSQDKILKLMSWLDLLYVALPPEWSLQSLIYDLKENMGYIAERHENLKEVLGRHPTERMAWSNSCKGLNALSCGYWKLLHVVTVGIAEHRGGLNLIDSGMRQWNCKTFSPMEAADTIRNFVGTFFFCQECSEHFTRDYDDCDKNRRCDRLALRETEATDGDWKELAMWLWEFHNGVSLRLLHAEKDAQRKKQQKRVLGPGNASPVEAIKVLWPNLKSCVTCFDLDGKWNEPMIFRHLEEVYWPGFDLDFSNVDNRLVWFEGEEKSSQTIFVFLAVALIILFFQLRRSLLSTPQMQRTMLVARRMGPAVNRGPKDRSH